MSIDVIGDFLVIIKNAVAVSKRSATVSYSHMKESISQILKDEGFIRDFKIEGEGVKRKIHLLFKYKDNESVIHKIKRISTPGCRKYCGFDEIKPVIGGLGVTILTTPHGVMTQKEARKKLVGGEVLCEIW